MTETNDILLTYPIRSVPPSRPFVWLQQGWDDLLHHSHASLAYGALVTVLGMLILAYSRHPFYIAAAWTCFLLTGPIITAGCCELSRRRDTGEVADFQQSLQPVSRNRRALLGVARTSPGDLHHCRRTRRFSSAIRRRAGLTQDPRHWRGIHT